MDVCVPAGTDWGCAFSPEEIATMREDAATAAQMDLAEAKAWSWLATLTADRVGVCPIIVRPCAAGCSAAGTWTQATAGASSFYGPPAGRTAAYQPWINAQGAWVNGCGCSGTECGCSSLSEVILPGPIGKVVEVWRNGAVMAPETYRVDNGNRLVLLIEGDSWPTCQDLMQDAHGPEAFSVTYYRGAAPSALILNAAGRLAVEFLKDCQDRPCALPKNMTSMNRAGVQITMEDEDGLTGMDDVDAVIRRLNPYLLKTAPRIVSPDSRRAPRMETFGVARG